MNITVARSSGFCFGVKNAVSAAENAVASSSDGKKLVMLGEIVHNRYVVDKLIEGGFVICEKADDCPPDSVVIIRAHGVTPEEISILESKGCEIRDMTCPFVSKIHKIVRENAEKGMNIIVAGTQGHPEVTGILGEAEGKGVKCAVIKAPEDLEGIDFPLESAILISQTTFSSEIFKKICQTVKNKIEKYNVFDTICITTESRQKEAASLSGLSDSMIVIGSAHSSNTRTRKDQSFLVPVDEIRANDYDLTINKYKEVEKVKVDYDDPAVVLGRIQALQEEIAAGLKEFLENYM